MRERYLVTGASGFAGSRLVDRLLERGREVVAIGRREDWAQRMASRKADNLTILRGDLANVQFVRSVWNEVGPFEGIFHFAAQIPAEIKGLPQDYDMAHYVRSNVLVTAALLSAASRQNKVRFVYASTISVFGRVDRLPITEQHPTSPADVYGVTKLQGEEWVKYAAEADRIHGITLRFPGMIGIGNDYGSVHFYTSTCLAGQPVSVYGIGQPRKDYIGVDDVVEVSILAMEHAPEFQYEVFNVGGCQPGVQPPTLIEIARMVAEANGGGEVTANDRKPAEPVDMYFDNLKASRLLGFIPHQLSKSIYDYVVQRKAQSLGPGEPAERTPSMENSARLATQ